MTDQTATPEPEPKRCEASHPTNSTVVPCVLVLGHDGDHFSTTGCAGSGIHWAPEPEWLTHLRQDMRAAIGSTPIASGLDVIASVATRVAAAHLRPIYAELVNARDEYEGTETRRVELEADVRALGGDPDRMVDPRDHEAAVLAMHVEMRAAADNWDRVAVNDACTVAERHMLRMAQDSLSVTSRGCPDYRVGNHDCSEACDVPTAPEVREVPDPSFATHVGYPDIEAMTRARMAGLDALSVREVPAGEAREGDTVTIVGRFRHEVGGADGSAYIEYRGVGPGAISDNAFSLTRPQVTVSRPISPLPDQPGAVIRAEVRIPGSSQRERIVAELGRAGRWLATSGSSYRPEELAEVQLLDQPAGAGVDEGGKP